MSTYYDLNDSATQCWKKADEIVDRATTLCNRNVINEDEYYRRMNDAAAKQRIAQRLEKHASRLMAEQWNRIFLAQFNDEKDREVDDYSEWMKQTEQMRHGG